MNIIFDFDGTLNDTAATYVPAFRLAYDHLVDIGYAEPRTFSRAEIMRWVGYSVKDMWDAFAPDLDASEKRACAKIIGDEMDRLALAGKARMFPGVPEALDALRAEGHVLHYLSNCSRAYMDFYREAFGLDRWITGFFCCEDYGWVPKTEIFPDVVRRFGSAEANRELARRAEASTAGDSSAVAVASHVRREFIMVGDRFHDLEVARVYGLNGVGCAYGFGKREEIADATVIVERPEDMLEGVRRAM